MDFIKTTKLSLKAQGKKRYTEDKKVLIQNLYGRIEIVFATVNSLLDKSMETLNIPLLKLFTKISIKLDKVFIELMGCTTSDIIYQ
jgi:hypothetical protein